MRIVYICVFLIGCGVKDKSHDAKKPDPPVCIQDLEHSPMLIEWPDGVARKSFVYICEDDIKKYCVNNDTCFYEAD